ncbi:MAG: hypothetical protein AAGB12_11065, partial [Pseudomonadota bacterium]
MITQQARLSLENMLKKNISENMGCGHTLQVIDNKNDISSEQVVVLTISSYTLRMLIFVFYTDDDSLKRQIADILALGSGNHVDDERVEDYLRELGNSICGGFKRDLGLIL